MSRFVLFFLLLYQKRDTGLRLRFGQCHVFTITICSFEARSGRLTRGHEESSVYAAAMLKSQTVWFMAVGRDRDQRRCQLLSRQPTPPWLLFPLSQEPNTGPGHRDRAGECEEFSQHICSLLCTFPLLRDVKSAAGPPRMRPPCSASEGA